MLVIDGVARTVSRVDTSNGAIRWTAGTGVRTLNTGAVVHDGVAWVHSTTGQLTAIDLESGVVTERLQVTTAANSFSAPVVAGGMLVVGDQDGVFHGFTLD